MLPKRLQYVWTRSNFHPGLFARSLSQWLCHPWAIQQRRHDDRHLLPVVSTASHLRSRPLTSNLAPIHTPRRIPQYSILIPPPSSSWAASRSFAARQKSQLAPTTPIPPVPRSQAPQWGTETASQCGVYSPSAKSRHPLLTTV